LTKLSIDSAASDLGYDLAVDATGAGKPSAVAAGLEMPQAAASPGGVPAYTWMLAIASGLLAAFVLVKPNRGEA
jgi:hypothetical protein